MKEFNEGYVGTLCILCIYTSRAIKYFPRVIMTLSLCHAYTLRKS